MDLETLDFPRATHVVDATLGMLNIQSGFGEPLHPGWPAMPKEEGVKAPRIDPWYSSPLVAALGVSGVRLLEGFAISIVAGATLGLLMWRFDSVDRFIGPLFLGLQTLPSVCWVPLAVLCYGINEKGILFVLVMGSFSAAALSLRDGLRTIPPLYPRAGLMLGARGWKLYRYVLLPASLPALAGSLRHRLLLRLALAHGRGTHLRRRKMARPGLSASNRPRFFRHCAGGGRDDHHGSDRHARRPLGLRHLATPGAGPIWAYMKRTVSINHQTFSFAEEFAPDVKLPERLASL